MYMIETHRAVYEVFKDDITISEGALPTTASQLLAFDDPQDLTPLANRSYFEFNASFDTAALYTTTSDSIPEIMFPLETLKEAYFNDNYNAQSRGTELYAYSNNINKTVEYFKTNSVKAHSLFEAESKEYRLERLADSVGTIVFTIVVLTAMSVSYYFIIRSSLISRIYEVSVYRALGVTKGDIRKIFVTEIVLITSLTSLLGYLVTTYILYRIQSVTEDYFEFIHISFLSLVAGIVLIYAINIISGILPVSNLLRKTPAEILSKYDL